jgi:threonine dehydrogenase-like Zn-dependent dehydrogenase
VIDALADGSLPAGPLITDVIDLAGVPDAFRTLSNPGARAKVLIEI